MRGVIGEELLIPFEIGARSASLGSKPLTPHFAFPFARGASGKIGTVEQDSPGHKMSCVQTITYCQLGARVERPDFGWRWPYMRMLPIDPTDLLDAIKRFEPRAETLTAEDARQLALMAVGADEINVDVGISNADPTGAGMGVND